MTIIPLNEGRFTVDATKKFIPFDPALDDIKRKSPGSLLVEIQPFCILTKKDIIILDTGLGFANPDGNLQIHQNLVNNGINPLDVTKVLLSHLHRDHAGGIFKTDLVLNHQFFSFPHASYYVSRKELKYALEKGPPSFQPDAFLHLQSSSQLIYTDGDGMIDDYIRYELSGAHSPWHQVFWIEEKGEKIFFGGDVAPQMMQMKNRFIARYDFDGRKSMELRQHWWQKGKEENWIFLFYHDISTPVFSF